MVITANQSNTWINTSRRDLKEPGISKSRIDMNGKVFSFLTVALLVCASSTQAQTSSPADLCALYNQALPASSIKSVKSGLWSDPGTWGGLVPTANDNVTVNHAVTLDQGSGREIQVKGSLEVSGILHAHGSILVCSGGVVSGSEGAIQFFVDDDRLFTGNTAPGPVSKAYGFHPEDNGLWVTGGGTLDIAAPRVTSWLDAVSISGKFAERKHDVLSSVAFADGKARLAYQPEGWRAGDQLLLVNERGEHALAVLNTMSGTSITYSATEDLVGEVLKIGGDSINPKVANLTRRFKIESPWVQEGDTNHRAHTAYLRGSSISLRNVEFRNLGPRGKLGRYPVHWHHAHESDGLLEGSAIWQSVNEGGNRFVVPHIVNGVTVADNVAFRSHGHGFFMEEVQEFDNVVVGNLSVDVRHGEELPNVDESISFRSHHFWLRESNTISGNVAAGNSWNGAGLGNKAPYIDGLVVLHSTKKDPAPLVTDFECLGCGGTAMWSSVPNTLFEDPKSAYALVAGYQAWDKWNTNSRGSEIVNPVFFFNGNNDLFKQTGDYMDRVPWASQIYLNYGEILVSGGVLAGDVGIHAHYGARLGIDGSSVHGDILLDPTYWELIANISNVEVYTDRLTSRGYGRAHRISPGFARLTDLCFFSECEGSGATPFSADITGRQFKTLLEQSVNVVDDLSVDYIATTQPVPASGYARIPAGLGIKYWSVAPVGTGNFLTARSIQEKEPLWDRNFALYGGISTASHLAIMTSDSIREAVNLRRLHPAL